MRRNALLALGSIAVAGLGFVACVSDAPADDTSGNDASTAGDGTTGSETSTGSDGSTTTCTGTQTACGTSCVDLTNDDDNCGKCGHSCMGDGCDKSQCKPTDILTGLNFPTSIATSNGTDQILVNTNSVIERCAKTGCGNAATPQWTDTAYATSATSPISLTNSNTGLGEFFQTIVFDSPSTTQLYLTDPVKPSATITTPTTHDSPTAGNPILGMSGDDVTMPGRSLILDNYGIFVCDDGLCQTGGPSTGTHTYIGDDDEQAATLQIGTPGNLIWANEGIVATCPIGSGDAGTCVSTNLYNASTTDTDAAVGSLQRFIAATSTTAYWVAKTDTTFAIESCAAPAGCANPKVMVANEGAIDSFAVDAAGIFWTDKEGGRLRACFDTTNGCGTSPVTVIDNLAQPAGVAIDSTYLFFTQSGTAAGQGKVTRVVR